MLSGYAIFFRLCQLTSNHLWGHKLSALFATGILTRSVDLSSSYQERFNNLILKKLLPGLHTTPHKSASVYRSDSGRMTGNSETVLIGYLTGRER